MRMDSLGFGLAVAAALALGAANAQGIDQEGEQETEQQPAAGDAGATDAPTVPEGADREPDPEDMEEATEETAPVVAFADPGRFVAEDGEALYRSICQACHMPDGEGAVGAAAYPALADNELLEFPDYPISVVIHGQRAMPPFGDYLDDQQVAAVVNFIRTSFGNEYSEPASAEQAAQAR